MPKTPSESKLQLYQVDASGQRVRKRFNEELITTADMRRPSSRQSRLTAKALQMQQSNAGGNSERGAQSAISGSRKSFFNKSNNNQSRMSRSRISIQEARSMINKVIGEMHDSPEKQEPEKEEENDANAQANE